MTDTLPYRSVRYTTGDLGTYRDLSELGAYRAEAETNSRFSDKVLTWVLLPIVTILTVAPELAIEIVAGTLDALQSSQDSNSTIYYPQKT